MGKKGNKNMVDAMERWEELSVCFWHAYLKRTLEMHDGCGLMVEGLHASIDKATFVYDARCQTLIEGITNSVSSGHQNHLAIIKRKSKQYYLCMYICNVCCLISFAYTPNR